MPVAVIVPALRPSRSLVQLIERLAGIGFQQLVIVDDGSGPEYRDVFSACAEFPGVEVLRHSENLGKGAALKTGMRYVLRAHADLEGVVTADADGQHAPEDIARVASRLAEKPGHLILGSRQFGAHVPWRSRTGNLVTRRLVRLLIGHNLKDTQTGLRAIPRSLLARLLEIRSRGYEFELDMLIAARHHGCDIDEVDICTVYEPGNPSSHFNPLFDSMRVWYVLARFALLSLATAVLDNFLFLATLPGTGSIALSQVIGRAGAVLFNYHAARHSVFLSEQRHRTLLPRYFLLVIVSGLGSYALILLLRSWFGWQTAAAKITAESVLFLVNFAIQREFVFRRKETLDATDWRRYYLKTPFTARITRRYTASVLVSALKRCAGGNVRAVVEFGGANSCFLDDIRRHLHPDEYHVVDTNLYGLELLRERTGQDAPMRLHHCDVMAFGLEVGADVAFSVGLVEHFDPAGTRQAIEAHLRVLRPGGCALISAPTPTWLYRVSRSVLELFGFWDFPDERPLRAGEIRASVAGLGEVVFEKVLWPLVLTQRLMVIRKLAAGQSASAK